MTLWREILKYSEADTHTFGSLGLSLTDTEKHNTCYSEVKVGKKINLSQLGHTSSLPSHSNIF